MVLLQSILIIRACSGIISYQLNVINSVLTMSRLCGIIANMSVRILFHVPALSNQIVLIGAYT